jgi:hypothetical protein
LGQNHAASAVRGLIDWPDGSYEVDQFSSGYSTAGGIQAYSSENLPMGDYATDINLVCLWTSSDDGSQLHDGADGCGLLGVKARYGGNILDNWTLT